MFLWYSVAEIFSIFPQFQLKFEVLDWLHWNIDMGSFVHLYMKPLPFSKSSKYSSGQQFFGKI